MKFDRNKAFPYPVLRPHSDDYLDVEFQTTVELVVAKDKVTAKISYAISSEDILREIENGNAEYVSVVSCRDTYYRRVLASQKQVLESEFDTGLLRGEVRVDPYVMVKKAIPSFACADINPEFGSSTFAFAPGDVLAQDESQVFYIDRDLFKPVTSIFDLVKNDNLGAGEWHIGFDQDHVQIEVSAQMKEAIDDARNSNTNRIVLLNSVYFAAVMQAVQKLKDGSDAFEDRKWAQVIQRQAHNHSLDISAHDSYIVAERLMQYPLSLLSSYVLKGKDQ